MIAIVDLINNDEPLYCLREIFGGCVGVVVGGGGGGRIAARCSCCVWRLGGWLCYWDSSMSEPPQLNGKKVFVLVHGGIKKLRELGESQ